MRKLHPSSIRLHQRRSKAQDRMKHAQPNMWQSVSTEFLPKDHKAHEHGGRGSAGAKTMV